MKPFDHATYGATGSRIPGSRFLRNFRHICWLCYYYLLFIFILSYNKDRYNICAPYINHGCSHRLRRVKLCFERYR